MFSEVRFQVASSLPTSIHQVSIEQRARLSPAKLIEDSPNAALPTKVRQNLSGYKMPALPAHRAI
jgi:hypothetical protein